MRRSMELALVAAVYFALASLGLLLAFPAEQVSVVWPASGFALAALLLVGRHLWPGIALGAFLANWTVAQAPVAAGIAAGNTVEALIGAFLLRSAFGFRADFDRIRDVLALAVAAAGLSTMLSATTGVASLCLGGLQPWSRFWLLWQHWWLGDAIGDLIVAPVLLTASGWLSHSRRNLAEAGILLASLAIVSLVVFASGMAPPTAHYSLEYALFPFLIWAAVRLGPEATACTVLVASCFAVVGTATAFDRLTRADLHSSLLLMQIFFGIAAITGMLLSAAISERREAEAALRRSEERLRELNASLEERIAERTAQSEERAAQLRRLAMELTRAEQRERRRLAQVLHDHLQQLLVATRMQVGGLQRRLSVPQDLQAVQQISLLLQQSIDASRSLTVELSPPVLYEGSLKMALEWLADQMLENYGLEVELDVEESAGLLDEDCRVLVFQAVQELLFNTFKHAGVRRASVRLHVHREEVRVAVEDRGRGFDTAAPPARKSDGFGLFSIRERVAHLGGRFTVESVPGRGTRFELVLPREDLIDETPDTPIPDSELQAGTMKVLPETETQRIRILVVDDHRLVRAGLVGLLSALPDLEIVGEAADAESAIEMVHRLRPDVVTMDIGLPGMNGIEATRIITSALPEVKVVGLSMHAEADMGPAMRLAGATAYVPKDSRADVLLAAVRACRVEPSSSVQPLAALAESRNP